MDLPYDRRQSQRWGRPCRLAPEQRSRGHNTESRRAGSSISCFDQPLCLCPPFIFPSPSRVSPFTRNSDNVSKTALHLTTSKANISTARKLLSHGASARVKDKRGQLALHRAAAIGSIPLIELMLASKSPLNATDISGLTALHHGKSVGDQNITRPRRR